MQYDAHFYMQKAYQEAVRACDEGEVPVGAVVVSENGRILGRGYNSMERLNDATAHAEILALGAASNSLGSWRLEKCTIFVTLEPCLMCLGAILNSRISKIVYGAQDRGMGAIDSFFFEQEALRAYKRYPEVISGVMEYECSALLKNFFSKIRKKS